MGPNVYTIKTSSKNGTKEEIKVFETINELHSYIDSLNALKMIGTIDDFILNPITDMVYSMSLKELSAMSLDDFLKIVRYKIK